MAERTVNARQLEVLTWIVDGCPEGVMSGVDHKTTAKALQRRRLVVVSGKGEAWSAKATDGGKYFVKHRHYPAGHWSAGAGRQRMSGTLGSSAPENVDQPRPGGEGKVTGLRPVEQMIADLIEAGGTLTVESSRDGYWEGLMRSANRYGKVPSGKLLRVDRGRTWKERVIRLDDPPGWMVAELDPIPVAEQLHRPHRVVQALRADRDRLPMKGETRARALRILDAIAKAAVARGYVVDAPPPEPGYRYPKGQLRIMVRRHANTVAIDELSDAVPHQPTAKELADHARYSWHRIPTHDYVPSGRLRLKLLTGWAIRQDAFADTKNIRLEDRLPVLVQEVELRAAAAEDRDRQAAREREERRRRWEQVHEEAKVKACDEHRARTLMEQVEQWKQLAELDAYLQAMAERIEVLEAGEQAAAHAWLDWARMYRSRIDPLSRPLTMPPDPEFTANTLAPYMGGMSPYGP